MIVNWRSQTSTGPVSSCDSAGGCKLVMYNSAGLSLSALFVFSGIDTSSIHCCSGCFSAKWPVISVSVSALNPPVVSPQFLADDQFILMLRLYASETFFVFIMLFIYSFFHSVIILVEMCLAVGHTEKVWPLCLPSIKVANLTGLSFLWIKMIRTPNFHMKVVFFSHGLMIQTNTFLTTFQLHYLLQPAWRPTWPSGQWFL